MEEKPFKAQVSRATRDQQYEDAFKSPEFKAWVESLSPEDLRAAKKNGLLGPDSSSKVHTSSRLSELRDELPAPKVVEPPSSKDDDKVSAICQIVATLLDSENLQLNVVALAFASGLSCCATWGSQAEAARYYGWSRGHLGKEVSAWMRKLSLPPNQYTAPKSKKAKLSSIQKKSHWRNRKYSAQTQPS